MSVRTRKYRQKYMNFISNITSSPMMAGATATVAALLYFFLMTFNPNLPPALVFSLVIGYFVYTMIASKNGIPSESQQSQPPIEQPSQPNMFMKAIRDKSVKPQSLPPAQPMDNQSNESSLGDNRDPMAP